ncbi:hypothetical protein T439DRAFT_328909 [Meredithblackwellia eburnea MCA 4105]
MGKKLKKQKSSLKNELETASPASIKSQSSLSKQPQSSSPIALVVSKSKATTTAATLSLNPAASDVFSTINDDQKSPGVGFPIGFGPRSIRSPSTSTTASSLSTLNTSSRPPLPRSSSSAGTSPPTPALSSSPPDAQPSSSVASSPSSTIVTSLPPSKLAGESTGRGGKSALTLLRTRLEVDQEARVREQEREREKRESSVDTLRPNDDNYGVGVGRKLRKRIPSFAKASGAMGTAADVRSAGTEQGGKEIAPPILDGSSTSGTTKRLGLSGDGADGDEDEDLELGDDGRPIWPSKPFAPSHSHVHQKPRTLRSRASNLALWGFDIGKGVASKVPVVGAWVAPSAPSHFDLSSNSRPTQPEEPETKVDSDVLSLTPTHKSTLSLSDRSWKALEVGAGVGLAIVLVSAVGAEWGLKKVWGGEAKVDKGKGRALEDDENLCNHVCCCFVFSPQH